MLGIAILVQLKLADQLLAQVATAAFSKQRPDEVNRLLVEYLSRPLPIPTAN